jgi:hypothetical protein
MADPAVVFRATFRERGYSDEDLEDLRAQLQGIVAVRLRGGKLPEAGGVAEFTALLEFIGVSLAKGGLAWIGGQVVSRVTKAVSGWWKRKAERGPWEPEVQAFLVSFDDVDVEFFAERRDESPDVFFLTAEAIAALPDALQILETHFSPEEIQKQGIGYIGVPLICDHSADPEVDKERAGKLDRYWKVGRGARFPTHLYDSVSRVYRDLPPRLLPPQKGSEGELG